MPYASLLLQREPQLLYFIRIFYAIMTLARNIGACHQITHLLLLAVEREILFFLGVHLQESVPLFQEAHERLAD